MSRLEEEIIESLKYTAENAYPTPNHFIKILNSVERNNSRKTKRYTYMKRTLSSAAVLIFMIGILITSAFVSPAMAAVVRNIPIINSIFEYMGDSGLKNAKNLGVVATLNQSAEDQGIRITINNVLYDDARIVVSFKEECNGEFKNFLNDKNDLLVNGKPAPGFGISITQKKVSEGVYVGLLTIDIQDSGIDPGISSDPKFFSGNLPDDFTLGLQFNEIVGVEGKWYFDIPLSKAESKKMTVKYKPQIVRSNNGVTLTLDEVIFSPSCVGLILSSEPFGKSGIGSYKVFDDKGKELEMISESIEEPLLLPVKNIPKSLRIVPYTPDSKTIRNAIPKQFPITISQGDLGDVTIQKIEFKPDKTLVYYTFLPKLPSAEPNRLVIERKEILPSGEYNILIEGFPQGLGEKLKAPEKTGENSYVQEYKAIDPNNELLIRTVQSVDPKPIEAYEMIVPLNNAVQ